MTALLDSAPHTAEHGDDHGHDPFLAHHFESHQHQFDSCKLGMWLFLITEVLFFSGLFCLYAVFRANHPEIFIAGHMFLDKTMGAVNTIVLLFSSLTMAWAVRAAQLGQQKVLVTCLSLTLACAGLFLVIKYFEYSAKISHGVLWASQFNEKEAAHYLATHHAGGEHAAADHGDTHGSAAPAADHAHDAQAHAEPAAAADASKGDAHAAAGDHPVPAASGAEPAVVDSHDPKLPANLGLFFSIYFCLTGLHGIHILAGMGAIAWVLRRSMRGDFGPHYFGPVDFVGLYWHLVDLIWIYLFPLLYLIH